MSERLIVTGGSGWEGVRSSLERGDRVVAVLDIGRGDPDGNLDWLIEQGGDLEIELGREVASTIPADTCAHARFHTDLGAGRLAENDVIVTTPATWPTLAAADDPTWRSIEVDGIVIAHRCFA